MQTNSFVNQNRGKKINLNELQIALDETHRFLDRIHLDSTDSQEWKNLLALIHILDHMQRLHERCDEEEDRAITTINTPALSELVLHLRNAIDLILKEAQTLDWVDSPSGTNCLEAVRWLDRVSNHLDHLIWHLKTIKT